MDSGMERDSYAMMERGMQGDAGERSGSGRSTGAGAVINASEDRERLLTRGVKNIMGVARDRRDRKAKRKTEQAKSECVWRA